MEILLGLLGGLGLFLYGMNVMSNGLQKAAGDKLKSIIGLLTTNRLMAVSVGAVVTAIIQSSSASTVMVVGFVNAGMMKLSQAVGVIMGANIGTTITAQIIAFRIERYAPIIIGISVGVWLFSKERKTKQLAEALIGFGILFLGLQLMSEALKPLGEHKAFRDALVSFGSFPLLGIVAGFFITAIIQSSSASMGILLALAMEGLVPIESGLPILFGINMGTTTTAIFSSIGANITAKRAAVFHFLFNFIGTVFFMLFFQGITYKLIVYLNPHNIPRQIANAHTFFNVVNTLVLLPFTNILVSMAKKIIPGTEELQPGIQYIDDRMLETPSIATVSVIKETLHMGNVTKLSLKNAIGGFMESDEKQIGETFKLERIINDIEREISSYLVKLSNTSLSLDNREAVYGLFNAINDIERVGDHADNIAELAQYKIDNRLIFSDTALRELKEIGELAIKAYNDALTTVETMDEDLAMEVLKTEGQVDVLERNLRANHIERLSNGTCIPASGVVFLDVISNLERIADHASNIAMTVMDKIRGV